MPAPTATEVMQGELCSQTDMDGWGAYPTFRTEMAHYAWAVPARDLGNVL